MYTGLRLDSFKHLCNTGTIEIMPAPNMVTLSLDQHADALLRSCVKVGETVALGQIIARPDISFSACLHSSVSGTVQTINANHIVISNNHKDTLDASLTPKSNWQTWSKTELIAHLAEGGIAGLGGAAYSTSAKLSAGQQQHIDTLIINGMECEPYITCDDHLLREQAAYILNGVQILLHACGASRAYVAIEDDKPLAIDAVRNALAQLNDQRISIQVFPTTYPHGDEGQLIGLLLSKEVPRGQLPSAIGVIVQNVATAFACAKWIYEGRPLISRVVTVTGHGIHECKNVEVRIGSACKDVIAYCGGYRGEISTLIMGGIMMGTALSSDEMPITKASNCLIAANHLDLAPNYIEQPCIRCGECAHACPVDLLPQQLLMNLRNQNTAAVEELGLRDCILCGCCDTVCPSHIALASRFRVAKLQLLG